MPTREQKQWEHHRANKQERLIRKQIKRNRDPRPVRQKDWTPDRWGGLDGQDDLFIPQSERVMPRGERSRRRALVSAALDTLREEAEQAEAPSLERDVGADAGWSDMGRPEAARSPIDRPKTGPIGTVIEVSTGLCRVRVDGGVEPRFDLICGVRGALSAEDTGFTNVVAVGDRVVISPGEGAADEVHPAEEGVIEAVLPRRSALTRPDVFYGHLQQVIVANADQLLIVAAWQDPVLWMELIDRYLIAAERHGLIPVICVNKVDLAASVEVCRAKMKPYLALGYRVLMTSALTGQGVDELSALLYGKTTVLAGMSGVGKSSLLAAVQPGLQLRIGEVSDFGEGRHTTSQVNLIELEMGGAVVDTPGIREFGLSGLRRAELVGFYPDLCGVRERGVNGRCRFADCSHTHEPGCAVKAAVRQGHVSPDRYHSYRKIYYSLPG